MLRIHYGGITTGTKITYWLYTETFILTLLIILSKRIKELIQFQESKRLAREVIKLYNAKSLYNLFILLNVIIFFIYTFYCFDQNVINRTNEKIWITIPLVFLGLCRFTYTTLKNENHASPINNLLQDKLLMIIISLWLITWFYLIY